MKCLVFLLVIMFAFVCFSVHFSGKSKWTPLKATIKIVVWNWGQGFLLSKVPLVFLLPETPEGTLVGLFYRIKKTLFMDPNNVVVCVFSPVVVF